MKAHELVIRSWQTPLQKCHFLRNKLKMHTKKQIAKQSAIHK